MHATPFAYDPSAPMPEGWLKFLKEIFPDDPQSIMALQEWFGYLLSGDTTQEKILLIIGPKRSGKGTILRIDHDRPQEPGGMDGNVADPDRDRDERAA